MFVGFSPTISIESTTESTLSYPGIAVRSYLDQRLLLTPLLSLLVAQELPAPLRFLRRTKVTLPAPVPEVAMPRRLLGKNQVCQGEEEWYGVVAPLVTNSDGLQPGSVLATSK